MRQRLICLACGVIGVVLALVAWHLYIDHQNLHAMLNAMIQAQAAQAAHGAAPK